MKDPKLVMFEQRIEGDESVRKSTPNKEKAGEMGAHGLNWGVRLSPEGKDF